MAVLPAKDWLTPLIKLNCWLPDKMNIPGVLYSSTIPAFKKSLEDDKNSLIDVQNDFFLLKNALEKENNTISSKIIRLNDMIKNINKENKTLKSSIKGLKEASESAMGMFDDAQRLYNQYLLGNIYLFGGVIGAGVIMYKSLNM